MPPNSRLAASEVLGLCGFKPDCAQVLGWVLGLQLAHPKPKLKLPTPIHRWRRSQISELWQLDASPHCWFPGISQAFAMLKLFDASSARNGTCTKTSWPAMTFFPPPSSNSAALETLRGLPAFLFSHVPDAHTQLGWALHFSGFSLRYAPTPQAKRKVEREHPFWKDGLPAYFAGEHLTTLGATNSNLTDIRRHGNRHEIHRQLQMTPPRGQQFSLWRVRLGRAGCAEVAAEQRRVEGWGCFSLWNVSG